MSVGRDSSELFRALNERIRELGPGASGDYDLVCECGDDRCAAVIRLTTNEVEALRTEPDQFAVVPGHERTGAAEVVARTGGYVVVRKAALVRKS